MTEPEQAVALVDSLHQQAEAIAVKNPPSRVLFAIFLGVFASIGWIFGRSWLALAHIVAFSHLALLHGFRKGAKVPTEPKKAAQH